MLWSLILQHARRNWTVVLLLWVALTALASLYVYAGNSARFTNRSMQLITKSLGHNLLILPKTASPLESHLCGDGQADFDQAITAVLAARTELPTRYHVSVLQQRVAVEGGQVILTGVAPVPRADETREKGNMIAPVKPGTCRLGAEAARVLGAQPGGAVGVQGLTLRVQAVLPPLGTLHDYRVYADLGQAQKALGRPGRINAVWAFLCQEGESLASVLARHQALMARAFPDYQTQVQTALAEGRYRARFSTSSYLDYLLAIVGGITVLLIVVAGLQEVAERRREVGMLLALGVGRLRLLALFALPVLAVSVAAAGSGYVIGSWCSIWLLSPVLTAHTQAVAFIPGQLPQVAGLTCLVAALAQVAPLIKLARMDPNAILVEE